MSQDALVMLVVAAGGLAVSWFVWASVTLFKHNQELALLRREVDVLGDIKEVLNDIRDQLREREK